jgi:hypothetical protein
LGEVRINFKIPGEAKFVDIWFIPSNRPNADLSELGILALIFLVLVSIIPIRLAIASPLETNQPGMGFGN